MIATPPPSVLPMDPSSDPPEFGAESPYAGTIQFIDSLSLRHPLRDFDRVTPLLIHNGYLHIDEVLQGVTKDELTGGEYALTGGNAKFLLDQIDDEMKRTERAKHLKRRRGRAWD